MRNVPRHARTDAVRPGKPARSAGLRGVSAPLRRAAEAAYARPHRAVPFERRTPAQQRDWTYTARRALQAALDPDELSEVIAAHSQYSYDAATGLYRCACGWYLTRDWQDHTAAVIRAHVLGSDRGLPLR
ncbi:hypothetical protein [Promicromonospora panici]|uniref:hypothetical protein n=1 Tax=Promicromonospora panici TaxID=2219658 RepID=UPI00101D1EB5|nr:hypothetical protein [Promicromonospora panici]